MPQHRAGLHNLHRTRRRRLDGRVSSPLDPEDDGQWTMAAKNYASTRFSGLNEINTSNVGRMRAAWTFSTGVTAGHEALRSSSVRRCSS